MKLTATLLAFSAFISLVAALPPGGSIDPCLKCQYRCDTNLSNAYKRCPYCPCNDPNYYCDAGDRQQQNQCRSCRVQAESVWQSCVNECGYNC
ncbi:hypothetical protein HK097_003784 [Rhizophlyctis rosea]|uniref:Uncharacterized protein n=1 Tax=Rhizophlyctis rosea TaxID=64517 RepID=A0AAD5S284_9FUNG|nr:hypothetical protein HK097_003784 [Rhizophlyctis rosea]